MSKPQNILGNFDTYAYHHILLVCNSTEAAEALAKTDEITTFQHPTTGSKYRARDVGKVRGGKYVTLIDGMTDATYFIMNAKWSNIIAASPEIGKGDIPKSTTMTTDGEMEIVEPLGASFLNRLTEICDELDTDPVGLVFMLKTIFVGHNANNGYSEMITQVRPFMFIVYDISAIFDNSGAKYKLEFVGLTNGAGKLPQPQKIFEGLSFKIYPSLSETFENLEILINDKYQDFKIKAAKDLAASLEGSNAQADAERFLIENYRDVQYKFFLDPEYTQKEKYPAGDVENDRLKDKLTGPMPVNFGGEVSVEEIINRVMASSSGILNDAKTENEEKYIYKIVSTLRTTNDEYTIEYHINRYQQAISPYTQQQKDGQIVPLPGQSIEFDYIFTGKNVDIKNFDIKMEMGMAFFQMAGTTDSVPSQQTSAEGSKSKTVHVGGNDVVAGTRLRGRTPLFLGSRLKKPMMRNTKRPIDSASFQALLERHAALENISAAMTIYGNPQLLDEMSILPSEVSAQQTEVPLEDATINPKWQSNPTLIKVNIKMPVEPNLVNTEYENFWYTGYYMLFSVDNIFSEGEFTQELSMFSIPSESEADTAVDPPKDEELTDFGWPAATDAEFEAAIAQEAALERQSEDKTAAANEQKVLTRRGYRIRKNTPIRHEFKTEE